MTENRRLEMEKDKKFIEDYNRMVENQALKRKQEREERNNKIKGKLK